MTTNRPARVSGEIKRELSDIIKNGLRDPRLPEMLSILDVEVTKDFAHAKVFYSILCAKGEEAEVEKAAAKALKGASGFIRRELGARIRIHRTPELHFVPDKSIERVISMNRLIDETVRDDAAKGS
ncbi:MAG: 30S ribosome-binding factor RbfA [Clostridiales bacterium]|jgi:ribosome-binding factor A|nr:30S ribosome-binding factor RbfA [Clostridiales bacterium]